MRGLRTQENEKFIKFFEIVQKEASKRGTIFFADCGMGDVVENEDYECEDACGWLLPSDLAERFEPLFLENSPKQHEYDDYYVFADYKIENGTIDVFFE